MRSVAYGARPLPLPENLVAEFCLPPAPGPDVDLQDLLTDALEHPIATAPLSTILDGDDEVTVVIGHSLVDEPRGAVMHAVLRELGGVPDKQIRIAVASEGRAPGSVAALGLGELAKRHVILNHDAGVAEDLVDLGTTSRGTRVRVPKSVARSTVVVLTGRIRPHMAAGFSGGADGIFPGLGTLEDIAQLDRLAEDPASRLGRVAGNPYREELEAAAKLLSARLFVLNVLFSHDRPIGAVAGHIVAAHRKGCEIGRRAFEITPSVAPTVVVSDGLPVTATLAEAMRLLAPAGALLQENGVAILAAECPRGTGPLDQVSREAFEHGVGRYFKGRGQEIYLVSSLPPAAVGQTFCRYASTLDEALAKAAAKPGNNSGGRVLVLPRAADILPGGNTL